MVAASYADRGRDGRAERFPVLAVVLALAAGAVDAACFARLGEVFAGVMTGNLTLLGLAVARPSATIAAHVAVALLGYVTGTAVGAVVASRVGSVDRPWAAPIRSVLLVELAALAVLTIGWVPVGGRPAGAAQLGLLAVAAMAMGLQAAAMHSAGTSLSTTFLTGTLTAAVAGLLTGGVAFPSLVEPGHSGRPHGRSRARRWCPRPRARLAARRTGRGRARRRGRPGVR